MPWFPGVFCRIGSRQGRRVRTPGSVPISTDCGVGRSCRGFFSHFPAPESPTASAKHGYALYFDPILLAAICLAPEYSLFHMRSQLCVRPFATTHPFFLICECYVILFRSGCAPVPHRSLMNCYPGHDPAQVQDRQACSPVAALAPLDDSPPSSCSVGAGQSCPVQFAGLAPPRSASLCQSSRETLFPRRVVDLASSSPRSSSEA